MTLAAGTRLGPYEILASIGAGGMGEVWKARDTRFDRLVAVTTIHAAFIERFEGEARAISTLNPPHICALYDVGEHDGAGYLVMEQARGRGLLCRARSVEGVDVAQRLSPRLLSGGLPVNVIPFEASPFVR